MLKRLDWDSEFWGFPVGHLMLDQESVAAGLPSVPALDDFTVVQSLFDYRSGSLARKLTDKGFFPVVNRLEFERPVGEALGDDDAGEQWPVSGPTRSSMMRDGDMTRYAATFVGQSRFRAFPVEREDVVRFYRTWIAQAMIGEYDDELVHFESEGRSVGFATYRVRDSELTIGLLAVSSEFRGRGVGNAILLALDRLAGEHGASMMKVVTEGTNYAARRTYTRAGFVVRTEALWMYRVT